MADGGSDVGLLGRVSSILETVANIFKSIKAVIGGVLMIILILIETANAYTNFCKYNASVAGMLKGLGKAYAGELGGLVEQTLEHCKLITPAPDALKVLAADSAPEAAPRLVVVGDASQDRTVALATTFGSSGFGYGKELTLEGESLAGLASSGKSVASASPEKDETKDAGRTTDTGAPEIPATGPNAAFAKKFADKVQKAPTVIAIPGAPIVKEGWVAVGFLPDDANFRFAGKKDLATLAAGDTITTIGEINLRKNAADWTRPLAVVPAGRRGMVLETPRRLPAGKLEQVWARVRFE